ncbi:restriction endonuclease subunit S [Janibacter massiliensis]|uniref:restriction endonuclease subunit S n=1 Tax=Janibacter massiliensis TaxID=2058291 RepID=UPI00131A5848|nr:hypothetical protein [Janibacter massiliensis]
MWTSNVDKLSSEGEQPVRLCNYVDVYRNDEIRLNDTLMLATARPDEIDRFHLEVGDTVLTKDSEDPTDIGVSAYVGETAPDLLCGYHLAIARPRAGVHPKYLSWSVRSRPVLAHFTKYASGISRYGLTTSGLLSAPIPMVGASEQRRIADFLDDRVARIDHVIFARQEQFHLTAGMRQSELQAIIDEYSINLRRRLQDFTDPSRPIQYGIVLPGPHFPGGVPIIKGGDIASGRLERGELSLTDPVIEAKYARSRVHPGDYVIAIRGSVGEVAAVPEDLKTANLTQDSARIASHGCNPQWLRLVLESARVQGEMEALMTGSTVRGINIESLRRVQIPVATPSGQETIARQGARLLEIHRGLQQGLRDSVRLLQEYKQSLITAAVTGQIDVTTASSRIPGVS